MREQQRAEVVPRLVGRHEGIGLDTGTAREADVKAGNTTRVWSGLSRPEAFIAALLPQVTRRLGQASATAAEVLPCPRASS